MKRWMLGVVTLLVIATAAHAQEMTDQQRRDLERQLRELEQQMRELQRKLGRDRIMLRTMPGGEALAFAIAAGGRPRLGVILQSERDLATDSVGAVLQAVTPDGPADQAGLRAGDIIVKFNDQSLVVRGGDQSPSDRLIELTRKAEPGDTVRVQYRRGKETKTATVVLRKVDDLGYAYSFTLPDSAMARARGAFERAREYVTLVGPEGRFDPAEFHLQMAFGERWSDMELTTLDASLGTYFGTTEGLLVVRAPKDTLLGLKSGDVILRIGGRVPTSPSHAIRILRSYEPGDEIRVDIMRDKRKTEITATVPRREGGLFWQEK